MENEEKRNARRIHFDQPVEADLSRVPVSLVDLSTSGARIRHNSPLAFMPGKRFVLEFLCEGERFHLKCQVVRSRMEQNRSTSRRPVYTSGVRFVDLDEASIEQLWGLMALLAIDVLEHEALGDLPFEFEILSH